MFGVNMYGSYRRWAREDCVQGVLGRRTDTDRVAGGTMMNWERRSRLGSIGDRTAATRWWVMRCGLERFPRYFVAGNAIGVPLQAVPSVCDGVVVAR